MTSQIISSPTQAEIDDVLIGGSSVRRVRLIYEFA